MENFQYTKKELERVYYYIKDSLINEVSPSRNPKAYILGGQPGAGKTTLHGILSEKESRNVIIINGDEYRKEHPHFKEIYNRFSDEYPTYTQQFANEITEMLIDQLSSEKFNLIIEGTLRTKDVPVNTCNLLRPKGYEVNLCVMAVHPEVSLKSTELRYELMKKLGKVPRVTSPKSHDDTVNNIVENLDFLYKSNLFNNISLFTREREQIYNQKQSPEKNPSKVLKHIFTTRTEKMEKSLQNINLQIDILRLDNITATKVRKR